MMVHSLTKRRKREFGTLMTLVSIWGTTIEILGPVIDGELIEWVIMKCWSKNECPKCGFLYPEPEHGSRYNCSRCKAEYVFYGACHPEPTGKVKQEIIEAAKKQGLDLRPAKGRFINSVPEQD